MGLFSIFSKPSAPDYETVLARLATDINEAKTHLSEIRLRERRFSLLINLYGIGLWALWVGLWWVHGLPLGLIGLSHRDLEGRVIGAAGIGGGPIFIWLLNRLVHFYFTRQRTREETHLRLLLTQQRKQVDEIKKATNYDSTRKLIEQYDNALGPQTPQRKTPDSPSPTGHGHGNAPGSAQAGKQMVKGPGGTPRAPGHLSGAGGTPAPALIGTPGSIPPGLSPEQASAALSMQMHSIQPVLPVAEKRWYDRIVDSILGEDPSHAAQSKYALVCGECFRHNGLVGSQYEWERMQWICPRCNYLNPPPLSRSSHPSSGFGPTSNLNINPNITPSKPLINNSPAQSPSSSNTTPHVQRASASPRNRRHLASSSGAGGKDTPRSSRLGKEVFSATSESSEEDDEDDEGVKNVSGERMEVDEE